MRDKIIDALFCLFLAVVLLINVMTPDQDISVAERRPLAQQPSWSADFVFGGEADTKLESYVLDQFAFRQNFRGLKAVFDSEVLRKTDNNGIFVKEGQIFKPDYPMNTGKAAELGTKIAEIYEKYLRSCNVKYAVIPEKTYYLAKDSGYLMTDYDALVDAMRQRLHSTLRAGGSMEYIPLKYSLDLDSYYSTDLHWRQEALQPVMEQLGRAFGFEPVQLSKSYHQEVYEPFYGSYYGQAALPLPADQLRYLTGNQLEKLIVTNYDGGSPKTVEGVYDKKQLGSVDSYSVFLGGNSPLITIENPELKNGKELIVFRDSFGSSLAPLLSSSYEKVTLIDLRFIGYDHIGQFVDFQDQDVLFLYNQGVLNSSDMIRK